MSGGNVWQQTFDWLTTAENWWGEAGIVNRTVEHIGLSAAGIGLACAVVLPIAFWLGHIGRGGIVALNLTNIGRAVPTYAALVLLVLGPLGATNASTIIALALFAAPPIMTNTYVGIREVDRDIVDAARGSGMSGRQVLTRVELPLATPMIMNGVRLAAVQVVATATIAALVGGGGLGRIISGGLGERNDGKLIAGALLVALLALLVEGLFALLQRVLSRSQGPKPGTDASGRRASRTLV
jgi:osmoprotectant transport system permease protein